MNWENGAGWSWLAFLVGLVVSIMLADSLGWNSPASILPEYPSGYYVPSPTPALWTTEGSPAPFEPVATMGPAPVVANPCSRPLGNARCRWLTEPPPYQCGGAIC